MTVCEQFLNELLAASPSARSKNRNLFQLHDMYITLPPPPPDPAAPWRGGEGRCSAGGGRGGGGEVLRRGEVWALTCTGVVIDPDVARVADAHEGAGCVHTHGVLPAVVFPLGALVDIWTEGRSAEKGGMKGLSH